MEYILIKRPFMNLNLLLNAELAINIMWKLNSGIIYFNTLPAILFLSSFIVKES